MGSCLVAAYGSWAGQQYCGYHFTTHCAAGLLFDAGVVPLATGEMSRFLPFPYTPKHNEQHGARPQHFLNLATFCHSSISSRHTHFFSLAPPTMHATNYPFTPLCFLSRSARPTMWPHHSKAGSQ